MMKKEVRLLWLTLVLFIAGFAAYGCASGYSGKAYGRDQAGRSLSVYYGTVLRVEPVAIEGTRSGVGTVGGGAAGGVAGSTIGSGRGSTLAAVAGALVGAAAGAAAEEGLTRKNALEIEVELDTGELIVVVQEADQTFSVGDRVRIVKGSDGKSKVRQ